MHTKGLSTGFIVPDKNGHNQSAQLLLKDHW
jgi:hypothetical protein